MTKEHSLEFYHAAIKSVNGYACDIRQPQISGKTAHVFYADIGPDTYVFRFTDDYFIQRNYKISQLLSLCDIPMPRVTTHCYMHTRFESYLYNPGITMYERNMISPLSDQEKFTIYQEILQIQYAMSKISMSDVSNIMYKYYSQIYSAKQILQHNKPTATALNTIIYAMSRIGKMHLFHNDPTPGNILLSPDNHLTCMIDLDGVCASNTEFALIKTLQYCPDIMWSDLLRYYEKISHNSQSVKLIILLMNLLRQIKPNFTEFVCTNNVQR